jgi:hypothetical protein
MMTLPEQHYACRCYVQVRIETVARCAVIPDSN